MNNDMNIGQRMRELRKSKNITVATMAEIMDVSLPTITRWENGSIDFPKSVLEKFCQKLEITYSQFFAVGDQDLVALPDDIWELVSDPNNHNLLMLIIDLKKEGISNDLISEMVKSISNTLRIAKKEGVYWAVDEVTEGQKEKAERFKKKINKPGFKPGEKK